MNDRGRALTWRPYGQHGVLIELSTLDHVHRAHRRALASGLTLESVPGASTLYAELAPGARVDDLLAALSGDDADRDDAPPPASHTVEVVYDGADLDDVAALTGLGVDEVIRRHTAPTYTVAFLGFSRAFPYLAGLDPSIVVPRLATPRTSVPAGSVGMGAGFTGIYPMSSPGGWRLLGRTRQRFFDERREPPSMLTIGDHVRFIAVDIDEGS
jgi:KipI family sensor histidine kinase inhibitor